MADSLDVNKWIRRAQIDYDDALTLAERFRPSIEGACFLCQQCAEKILKAYTIAKTNTRTKTHILADLLYECGKYDADFNNLVSVCSRLSPYISFARYPTDIDPIEHHMKQALNDAREILEFTKEKLRELGYECETEQT